MPNVDLNPFEPQLAMVVRSEVLRFQRECLSHYTPHCVLLAGQPGSGKTELSAMLMGSMFAGDAAFINGDEYRRYHPQYRQLYQEFGSDSVQMTSPFSNAVTERLIEELSDLRFNLVIEGTGRTVQVPKATAELLTTKGYTVDMAVIAARPEVSLISTLLRFYRMNEGGTIPRATAISAHDNIVAVLPGNLDTLNSFPCISRLSIWNRELELLFDSSSDVVLPSEVLSEYWHSSWTEDEIRNAKATIDVLREKEQRSQLGQGNAIDELAQRIEAAEMKEPTPDMTMM